MIKAAKQNYYQNKLNKEADNPKKIWRTIDTLFGRKQSKLPSSFMHINTMINDPLDVVEAFNNN